MAVKRLDELNSLVEDPALWDDAERAQNIMRERTKLEDSTKTIREIETTIKDSAEMIEMAEAEGDEAIILETEATLNKILVDVQKRQLNSLLSGEADSNDAFLEVNSGAGGTEAQDWAEMVLRMYIRWGEAHGHKVTILDMNTADEAGIKSATIQISGDMAYGWLKTESGVHRLVRISPFDSNAKRHTSFASVVVSPVIDDTIDIEIDEKDLRIDTYRSSGAGGQHVNTTDSAVRITHIPTNTIVACQNERSQHKNKATAMTMLKAKMYEAEIQRREAEASDAHGEKSDIGWGHQIRSYVLHPYQMVKDQRTGHETSNTQAVLNGDIDGFLETTLAHRLGMDE